MKPAKRYASPASAVPDILIIRALENRFGNLVPYQHRCCLLWCVHVATLSGFLKLPTLALLISDDRFIEHINCYPDNECVPRSSWRLLKCTCLNKNVSFHIIKVCLNLICLWNKWLAMRERSIFEQQKTHEKTKHPKLAHIWRMLSYPGWNMPAFRKCLVELKTQTRLPRRTQDSSNDLFPNM